MIVRMELIKIRKLTEHTFLIYTGNDTVNYKNGEVYYVREINTSGIYTLIDSSCNETYVTENMINEKFKNMKDIKGGNRNE